MTGMDEVVNASATLPAVQSASAQLSTALLFGTQEGAVAMCTDTCLHVPAELCVE